jgi:hypothetical protein
LAVIGPLEIVSAGAVASRALTGVLVGGGG